MTGRRNDPPNRPRHHTQRAPDPGGGTVVLEADFDTRLAGGKRQAFNGVVRGAPMFDDIVQAFRHRRNHVHETVKGLFKASPALVHASPQQICIEVALQFIGASQLAETGGTTIPRLRAMLARMIEYMPVNQITLAMSRMKLHDRDLAADSDSAAAIKEWRESHGPWGNPNSRRRTSMHTKWTGEAQSALKYIERANDLRRRHRGDLRDAPVLELCTEVDGKHRAVDRSFVDGIFPDIA